MFGCLQLFKAFGTPKTVRQNNSLAKQEQNANTLRCARQAWPLAADHREGAHGPLPRRALRGGLRAELLQHRTEGDLALVEVVPRTPLSLQNSAAYEHVWNADPRTVRKRGTQNGFSSRVAHCDNTCRLSALLPSQSRSFELATALGGARRGASNSGAARRLYGVSNALYTRLSALRGPPRTAAQRSRAGSPGRWPRRARTRPRRRACTGRAARSASGSAGGCSRGRGRGGRRTSVGAWG